MMISDPERFSKIASGIQSFVVAIAIFIGGVWTLYTFNSQLQVENARGQLEKLQRELTRVPKLEIEISVTPIKVPGEKRRILIGEIVVINVGNADTALNFDDRPIHLFKVNIDSTGETNWQLIHKVNSQVSQTEDLGSLNSYAGTKNIATFATFVNQPGLYVISIEADKSKSEKERARHAGAFEKWGDLHSTWGRGHYFVVE